MKSKLQYILAGLPRLVFLSDDRFEGTRLTIPHVTEDDMGGYLCIANNRVPPAMSKRVFMSVQCKFKLGQGILNEGDGSVQLTSLLR